MGCQHGIHTRHAHTGMSKQLVFAATSCSGTAGLRCKIFFLQQFHVPTHACMDAHIPTHVNPHTVPTQVNPHSPQTCVPPHSPHTCIHKGRHACSCAKLQDSVNVHKSRETCVYLKRNHWLKTALLMYSHASLHCPLIEANSRIRGRLCRTS